MEPTIASQLGGYAALALVLALAYAAQVAYRRATARRAAPAPAPTALFLVDDYGRAVVIDSAPAASFKVAA